MLAETLKQKNSSVRYIQWSVFTYIQWSVGISPSYVVVPDPGNGDKIYGTALSLISGPGSGLGSRKEKLVKCLKSYMLGRIFFFRCFIAFLCIFWAWEKHY
jgi:hypothetical protein